MYAASYSKESQQSAYDIFSGFSYGYVWQHRDVCPYSIPEVLLGTEVPRRQAAEYRLGE